MEDSTPAKWIFWATGWSNGDFDTIGVQPYCIEVDGDAIRIVGEHSTEIPLSEVGGCRVAYRGHRVSMFMPGVSLHARGRGVVVLRICNPLNPTDPSDLRGEPQAFCRVVNGLKSGSQSPPVEQNPYLRPEDPQGMRVTYAQREWDSRTSPWDYRMDKARRSLGLHDLAVFVGVVAAVVGVVMLVVWVALG